MFLQNMFSTELELKTLFGPHHQRSYTQNNITNINAITLTLAINRCVYILCLTHKLGDSDCVIKEEMFVIILVIMI